MSTMRKRAFAEEDVYNPTHIITGSSMEAKVVGAESKRIARTAKVKSGQVTYTS